VTIPIRTYKQGRKTQKRRIRGVHCSSTSSQLWGQRIASTTVVREATKLYRKKKEGTNTKEQKVNAALVRRGRSESGSCVGGGGSQGEKKRSIEPSPSAET